MELFRDRINGERKSAREWFDVYPKKDYSWTDWKSQFLISEWEEDVRFALGLGMTTIIIGENKKPLKGITFKGRDYRSPSFEVIMDALRKKHLMIGAEMGRANMICLDYDRPIREKDYAYQFETLTGLTPHGSHFYFWNDVFHVRIPKLCSYDGPPLKIGKSRWLKQFMRETDPTLLDALISETDITRIRNEISWIPPSETPNGPYTWAEPRRPPQLFSELLISLHEGTLP